MKKVRWRHVGWMNFQMKISQEKKNKKLDIIWRWAMFNMASLSLLSLFPLIHVFKWTYGQTSDGQTYNSLHHSFTLNKIPSQFLKEENSFTLARVELFSPKTKKQKKTKMIISNFFFDWVQVRAYRNQKKKNTTGGPIFLFPILWSMLYSFSTFHFFFRCRYLLRWFVFLYSWPMSSTLGRFGRHRTQCAACVWVYRTETTNRKKRIREKRLK